MSKQTRRIKKLIAIARENKLRYNAIAEHYDCGHELMCYISTDASEAYREYEKAIAELEKIDPTFPKESR